MNGWVRDFFGKNAYSILVGILTLTGFLFKMNGDLNGALRKIDEIAPIVRNLEKSQAAQEQLNISVKESLARIENKLDRALRK